MTPTGDLDLDLPNVECSISNAFVEEDLMPTWVEWPSSGMEEERAGDNQTQAGDLGASLPLLTTPPHARRAHQESPAALPRAKRPLSLAPDPLSLSLVHTPSMNPTLDLRPHTPLPTPKGQRLFDFRHHKVAPAPAPAPPADLPPCLQPATTTELVAKTDSCAIQSDGQAAASQPPVSVVSSSQNMSLQAPIGSSPSSGHIALQAPISMSSPTQVSISPTRQTAPSPSSAAQPPSNQTSASQAVTAPPTAPNQQPAPPQLRSAPDSPHHASPPEASKLSAAQSELLTELTTASQLVQQQSARQAELLEGLEQALSQISQHCLLVQNPAAVSQHGPLRIAESAVNELGERFTTTSIIIDCCCYCCSCY